MARTRGSRRARPARTSKVPSVEWLSVKSSSKSYRSRTCCMIGRRASYSGSTFRSSLKTGMQMLISGLCSDMFYSQRHVLSSQGQPSQPRFERPQPCQKSRHENNVVPTFQPQAGSGETPGSFTQRQQDGVLVEGAPPDHPARHRICGVVLEDGEQASAVKPVGKVLYDPRSLLRRDVVHHVRHNDQSVILRKVIQGRGKQALGRSEEHTSELQ